MIAPAGPRCRVCARLAERFPLVKLRAPTHVQGEATLRLPLYYCHEHASELSVGDILTDQRWKMVSQSLIRQGKPAPLRRLSRLSWGLL